jgi:acetoin utilization protein AcuB
MADAAFLFDWAPPRLPAGWHAIDPTPRMRRDLAPARALRDRGTAHRAHEGGAMKRLPIRGYMTLAPYTIGVDQPLSAASRTMREHQIRHLPVLAAGKLVGMVTQRDLRLIESLRDVDPDRVTVEEAMTPEPYCIAPDASLEGVVKEMAEHKYGSAIIVEHEKVVGVFTTIDALRALQGLLHGARQA